MEFATATRLGLAAEDLGRDDVSVCSFWAVLDASLVNISTVCGGTHEVNWFKETLKTEEAAGWYILIARKSHLFNSDCVVSWANLNIKNVEISSLLTLDGVAVTS